MTGEGQSIAVIGAGSWGTTIAHTLAGRAAVSLWARDPALAAELLARRTNHRYLPGAVLDPRVGVHDDLAAAVAGASVVLVAVPTVGLRARHAPAHDRGDRRGRTRSPSGGAHRSQPGP